MDARSRLSSMAHEDQACWPLPLLVYQLRPALQLGYLVLQPGHREVLSLLRTCTSTHCIE
uniref:Uncharacterized protein n=1 Tax=Arundo donax TaxID=35708 RepID=A0A0A8XR82_ARUDO